MKKYCRDYEAAALSALEEGRVTQKVFEAHREKISWLQHERLVHLIVTVMIVFVELFVLGVVLMTWNILATVVMLGLAVLLGFYFYHYFFLENAVQRWYVIADRMRELLESDSNDQNP